MPSFQGWQEATLKLRPDDDVEGMTWDLEMAREYRFLGSNQAFLHFLAAVRLQRENMIRSLVAEEKEGGKWREAIKLCDQILLIPEKMVNDGRESGLMLVKLGKVVDE